MSYLLFNVIFLNVEIELEEGSRYITTGIYERSVNSIIITELPVGKWTQVYK